MKFALASLAALFSTSALAATLCGELKTQTVFCVRAPCPPLTSFSTGAGRPFAVKADETSEAMKFLTSLRGGKTYRVCIKGQIERENLIRAESIRFR